MFDTKSNKRTNLDTIADYTVKDDSIWLDNAVFTNKIGKGTPRSPRKLNKAFFKVGTKAGDKNDYIVYNKAKGVAVLRQRRLRLQGDGRDRQIRQEAEPHDQ